MTMELKQMGPTVIVSEDLETGLEETVFIRPVANDAEMKMVHRLTHDCYVAKGYAKPQPNGQLNHYPEFDRLPQTTVFVAIHHGEVVGSISMTVDGPKGLTVDGDFKEECDAMRKSGRKLATAWRLVMKHSVNPSRRILMALIKETATLATRKGANTWLFTVNPRHESVYRRLLKMYAVSYKEGTHGLVSAPAVLLRSDNESLSGAWRSLVESTQIGVTA